MLGINIGRARGSLTEPPGAETTAKFASAERTWRVVSQASTIRRTGASVLDLCYVAEGAYDGYVDLRDRLTPENFLAPSLIVTEAGGEFTGQDGRPLGTVEFTHPYSVVAAANRSLLDEILAQSRQA